MVAITTRLGKTKKDHQTGAHRNRFANREARNAWLNDSKSTRADFPYETCNGKKGRRWKAVKI